MMNSRRWIPILSLMAVLLFYLQLSLLRARLDYTTVDMERFFEFIPRSTIGILWPEYVNITEILHNISSNRIVTVKPVNKPSFNFTILNPNRCELFHDKTQSNEFTLNLLMLIKSAPGHFDQRNAIRQTWGNPNCWASVKIVRIFMLGAVRDTDLQTKLESEHSTYGDIIQQNFYDSYFNVTYKMMMGMEWAVTYCSKSDVIMFVDDDFFVHPEKNVNILKQIHKYFDTAFIAGRLIMRGEPIRDPSNKWFLSPDEYPYEYYPPYFHAGHYFISMDLVRKLRIAMWYTKYLRFDDVYLGFVLTKMDYSRVDIRSICITPRKSSSTVRASSSTHGCHDPTHQIYVWNRLNCQSFCTYPSISENT